MQLSSHDTHTHYPVHEFWETASQYEPELVLQEVICNITSNVMPIKTWTTGMLVEWLEQLTFLGANRLPICSAVSELCIDGDAFERIINSKKRLFRLLKLQFVDRERIRVILFEWKHALPCAAHSNSTSTPTPIAPSSDTKKKSSVNSDYTPIGVQLGTVVDMRQCQRELALSLVRTDTKCAETGVGGIYGQLLVLGYKEYRFVNGDDTNWTSRGLPNETFVLQRRNTPNWQSVVGKVIPSVATGSDSCVNGPSRSCSSHHTHGSCSVLFTPALNHLVSGSNTASVTRDTLLVSPAAADGSSLLVPHCIDVVADMYQIGRVGVGTSSPNDFQVPGLIYKSSANNSTDEKANRGSSSNSSSSSISNSNSNNRSNNNASSVLHHRDGTLKEAGPTGRFACRIRCDRVPPYNCYLYGGGFDFDGLITVPHHRAVEVEIEMETTGINSSARSDDKEDCTGIDGFTAFAVKLWQPEVQQWCEISVFGNSFKPRRSATDSVSRDPSGNPLGNLLTDGSIIELSGTLLMFQNPYRMATALDLSPLTASSATPPTFLDNGTFSLATKRKSTALSPRKAQMVVEARCSRRSSSRTYLDILAELNALKPQCPVLFSNLMFSYVSPEKRARLQLQLAFDQTRCCNGSPAKTYGDVRLHTNFHVPEVDLSPVVNEEQRAFVFPACGHVHGYHPSMAKQNKCTLCRQTGPFVPVAFSFQPFVCAERPSHVFNPCGHVASQSTCAKWAAIKVPSKDLRSRTTSPRHHHHPSHPHHRGLPSHNSNNNRDGSGGRLTGASIGGSRRDTVSPLDFAVSTSPTAVSFPTCSICPFCATELDRTRPYSKLIVQSEELSVTEETAMIETKNDFSRTGPTSDIPGIHESSLRMEFCDSLPTATANLGSAEVPNSSRDTVRERNHSSVYAASTYVDGANADTTMTSDRGGDPGAMKKALDIANAALSDMNSALLNTHLNKCEAVLERVEAAKSGCMNKAQVTPRTRHYVDVIESCQRVLQLHFASGQCSAGLRTTTIDGDSGTHSSDISHSVVSLHLIGAPIATTSTDSVLVTLRAPHSRSGDDGTGVSDDDEYEKAPTIRQEACFAGGKSTCVGGVGYKKKARSGRESSGDDDDTCKSQFKAVRRFPSYAPQLAASSEEMEEAHL